MNEDLPLDLLRSFVAIVEAGTVRKAAELMHRTAPALSLQMSRLEDAAGVALFEKAGRGIVLSSAGEKLLPLAIDLLARHDAVRAALNSSVVSGPARLGIVQDLAQLLLPNILKRVKRKHEDASLSVVVGNSAELATLLSDNKIDVMLAHASHKSHDQAQLRCAASWIGDKALMARDRLPLVLVSDPCPYADIARNALHGIGRSYEVVLSTPSLEGMRAAVAAGIGIGCRNTWAAGKDLPVITSGKLPRLPDVTYALKWRSTLGLAARTLADETKNAMERFRS